MKAISFLAGELFFAAVWVLIRALLWIRRRKINWKRELQLIIMYINLAVIIRYTFFPFSRVNGEIQPLMFDSSRVFPFRINLVPFVNIADYDTRRDTIINIIGNTAMFIPSGIVLPVLYKKLDTFLKVVGTGAFMSLCIEIIQLPFSVRASDVDDIILNTAGCAAGYILYALVRKLVRRKKKIVQP